MLVGSYLHFTISEIHKSQFEKIIENEIKKVENKFDTKINIEFSFQKAIWSGYPGSSLIFLSADMLDTDHPIPL